VRKLILITVVVALLGGAGSALALTHAGRGPARSADYTSCLKTASTTAALQTCINAELKRLGGQLSSAYKKLVATSGADKTKLAAAQSRWTAFRDADCKFAASIHAGGSLAPIDMGTCQVDLTTARVTELRNNQKQLHP
jgi:uncharacterized protein YecT (DUF1311 family)